MSRYGYLSEITYDLQAAFRLQSSFGEAVAYTGCLALLVQNGQGGWVCYEYPDYGREAYFMLKDAYSFGRMFHALCLKRAVSVKRYERLMFRRPFRVFNLGEDVCASLWFDHSVSVSFTEGSYYNYRTEVSLVVVLDNEMFTIGNYGALCYAVSVYSLHGLLAELFFQPAVSGTPGEQQFVLWVGELFGDVECRIRRCE